MSDIPAATAGLLQGTQPRGHRRDLNTAVGRWSGVGPYYAMFPVPFAFDIVDRFSRLSDGVLDPFSGRASSVFAAAALGRRGLGIEINPVGWLYGRVKLAPAAKEPVLNRIRELGRKAEELDTSALETLPEFFRMCFAPNVLKYLVTARGELAWRTRQTDATIMAFLLVYLHGKPSEALSNQMRQSKALSPSYAVRWWRDRGFLPPERDVPDFLASRVEWRYAKGIPEVAPSEIIFGDSTRILPRLAQRRLRGPSRTFDLLFTSPPYFSVTNYHYDQWLRLWLLGGLDHPTRNGGPSQSKFASKQQYAELLLKTFCGAAALMNEKAKVYVRTDARPFTLETTVATLRSAFPTKRLSIIPSPLSRQSQTALFGDKSVKPGEIDLLMEPA